MLTPESLNLLEKLEFKWEYDLKLNSGEKQSSPQFSMESVNGTWHIEAKCVRSWQDKIVSVWLVMDSNQPDDILLDFIIGLEGNNAKTNQLKTGSCKFEPKTSKETKLEQFTFPTYSDAKARFFLVLYSGVTNTEILRCCAKTNKSLRDDLSRILKTSTYSDIILEIGDCEIAAHKVILSARSPVFAAMFAHDMAERQSNRVEITDCSPEAMKHLLSFMYCGEVSAWTQDIAEELLKASNKYAILDLMAICEKYLITQLSESNAVELLNLADDHCAEELKESALQFICKHLEYFKDPTKMKLLKNKTGLLREIISKIACHVIASHQ